MRTLGTCKNCSTQIHAGHKFCIECGVLIDISGEKVLEVECETHPNHLAVGFCVICSKPVCVDCEVISYGKVLCTDPEHILLLQEWYLMQQLDSEFEADALMRNLADGGIEAKTFSLHSHIAAYWLNEDRVLLFVKKSEKEKAKTLLKELNLINNN